jgi:hypothetical protein
MRYSTSQNASEGLAVWIVLRSVPFALLEFYHDSTYG